MPWPAYVYTAYMVYTIKLLISSRKNAHLSLILEMYIIQKKNYTSHIHTQNKNKEIC